MAHTVHTTRQLRIVRPYISPESEQLASKHGLGQPTAEYTTRLPQVKIVYSGICLALVMLLIVVVFMTETITEQAIGLVCALFFLCLGLIAPINWLWRRSWHIVACVDGFVLSKGRRVYAFHWEQIEAIWQHASRQYYNGLYTGTAHKYTIKRNDGKRVVFDDTFFNIEKFGTTVGREVTHNLLPDVIMAYNRGDTVTFGKLTINSKGIHDGQELLSWSQIKSVTINQGAVMINQGGKVVNWSAAKVAKIPNILVFIGLTEYVLGRQKFAASASR